MTLLQFTSILAHRSTVDHIKTKEARKNIFINRFRVGFGSILALEASPKDMTSPGNDGNAQKASLDQPAWPPDRPGPASPAWPGQPGPACPAQPGQPGPTRTESQAGWLAWSWSAWPAQSSVEAHYWTSFRSVSDLIICFDRIRDLLVI